MLSKSNLAQGVRWDLKDLYRSPLDPQVQADLDQAKTQAFDFEKRYKPFFDPAVSKKALPLFELLQDYKKIAALTSKLASFSHLYFAEQTEIGRAHV